MKSKETPAAATSPTLVSATSVIGVGMLQRRLGVGYTVASDILEACRAAGMVGEQPTEPGGNIYPLRPALKPAGLRSGLSAPEIEALEIMRRDARLKGWRYILRERRFHRAFKTRYEAGMPVDEIVQWMKANFSPNQ